MFEPSVELLAPAVFAAVVAHVLTLTLPETVRSGGAALVRQNFRGEEIPTSQGMAFVLAASVAIFGSIPLGTVAVSDGSAFLFGLMGMSLVGMLDDAVGGEDSRGLRGHLGRLVRGTLTTGGLKALYGAGVAVAVSATRAPAGIFELLIGAAVIALSTNAVNLFDLRPGRAGKVYLAISVVLLFATPRLAPLLLPLSAAVLVYLPADLAARGMMGDTGANALGFALGFGVVAGASTVWQLAVLGALVSLHLVAERTSLGTWIEQLPVLRSVDAWGRAERGDTSQSEGEDTESD